MLVVLIWRWHVIDNMVTWTQRRYVIDDMVIWTLLCNYQCNLYETGGVKTRQTALYFATEIVSIAFFVLDILHKEVYLLIWLCMSKWIWNPTVSLFSDPQCPSQRVSCLALLSPLFFDFFFQSAFLGELTAHRVYKVTFAQPCFE